MIGVTPRVAWYSLSGQNTSLTPGGCCCWCWPCSGRGTGLTQRDLQPQVWDEDRLEQYVVRGEDQLEQHVVWGEDQLEQHVVWGELCETMSPMCY